jgi:hypothetical protein
VDVTNVAPRLTSVPTISTPEDTTLNSTAAQNLLTNAHDDDGDALAVTGLPSAAPATSRATPRRWQAMAI